MRKRVIDPAGVRPKASSEQEWLDLEQLARVEVTSEDPDFPVESALSLGAEGPGWRAAQAGKQIIRILLDTRRPIHRIRLEFSEPSIERTQEFTLRWSAEPGGPLQEIVRQQWNFNPHGSTSEVEDYLVELDSVSVLELALNPDISRDNTIATLARWRVG